MKMLRSKAWALNLNGCGLSEIKIIPAEGENSIKCHHQNWICRCVCLAVCWHLIASHAAGRALWFAIKFVALSLSPGDRKRFHIECWFSYDLMTASLPNPRNRFSPLSAMQNQNSNVYSSAMNGIRWFFIHPFDASAWNVRGMCAQPSECHLEHGVIFIDGVSVFTRAQTEFIPNLNLHTYLMTLVIITEH